MTPPKLTFYRMTDEDVAAQELFDAQARHDEDRCTCKNPEGFTLEIEEGHILVEHTGCGKKPWFMHDDWPDVVYMEKMPIRVKQVTGFSGYPCYTDSCDCGPEVTLIPEEK